VGFPLAVNLGFLRYVLDRLFSVLIHKSRSQITLAMLSPKYESNNVINLPVLTGSDETTR